MHAPQKRSPSEDRRCWTRQTSEEDADLGPQPASAARSPRPLSRVRTQQGADAMDLTIYTFSTALLLYTLLAILTCYCCRGRGPPTSDREVGDGKLGAASSKESTGTEWWHSPLASPSETALVAQAKKIVLSEGLAPLPLYVDLELLRHLRALGRSATAKSLAVAYGNALRWRRENVILPRGQTADPSSRLHLWPSELEHGAHASARSAMSVEG